MKIAAYGIILFALVIGIVPHWTQCNPEGGMKCHWTAQAALALAVPLFVVGAVAAVEKNRAARRALGVVAATLGIMVIMLPATLFGVCMADTMSCNMVMKPSLLFAGLIAAALGVTMIFAARSDSR